MAAIGEVYSYQGYLVELPSNTYQHIAAVEVSKGENKSADKYVTLCWGTTLPFDRNNVCHRGSCAKAKKSKFYGLICKGQHNIAQDVARAYKSATGTQIHVVIIEKHLALVTQWPEHN